MESDPSLLCRSFVKQAKAAISAFPQLKHTWSIDDDEDHCILDFPETDSDGFPVTVEVFPDRINVTAGSTHVHFDLLMGSMDGLATDVLGLVRDMLSPGMRVHEFLAGGKAYKWNLESSQDGRWVVENTLGLLFFRWFGYREEKYYQNRALPARENKLIHGQSQPNIG